MSGRVILLCLLFSCAWAERRADGPPPERTHAVAVDLTTSLGFYSGFWINLHHVLYAEAWARRAGPAKRKLAGAFPAPLTATLTDAERRAWNAAVDYYDQHIADRDLLFDDELRKVNDALSECPESGPPTGFPGELAAVLERVGDIYRAHWWPAHDRANRTWIADTEPRVAALGHAVAPLLAKRYGKPWFTDQVRVDVVFVASSDGAYTSLGPTHITISATDPASQQWAAAEAVYHEASHGLVKPVCDAFDRATAAAHVSAPELCHVALFYLTGEVVRRVLEGRGIAYKTYLEATGLLDRAWPKLRAPLEHDWRPYVDGDVMLDDAVQRMVAALPAT